jgi:hypothetical protein
MQNLQKKQLISEIVRKKKELEEIEDSQNKLGFVESEAEVRARVKAEKDRIKKM